jgi:hypothetical protein
MKFISLIYKKNSISISGLKRCIFALMLILILITTGGCKIADWLFGVDDILDELTNITNDTNIILEQAIQDLNANADNYGHIMEEAIDDISDANIKEQLKDALNHAIYMASSEIRCNIRFTADYLIHRIKTIIAIINNQDPPIDEPFVCNALPSEINMNLPANQRSFVNVTGYFLNEAFDKYRLVLKSTTGSLTDRTSELSVSSDFKLVIDLGATGITLNNNSDNLILKWDENLVTDIPVIQRLPELCNVKERSLVNLPKMVIYPEHKKSPWAKKGDKEFNGNGPCTTGSVSIFTRNNQTELWVRGYVQMWECPDDLARIKSDYTYGDKTKEIKLASSDTGYRFKRIKDARYDSFQNIDKREDRTESVSGSGPVAQYLIHGDTSGDDLGSSRVEITFKAISVTLEELGDCIRN